MAHHAFEEQMEALDALHGHPLDADAVTLVRKYLASRNNLLVAKAARLAEDNNLTQLMPELISAFDRFFTHPEKTDPQCWAKNAISRALAKLGCREPDVFLRGLGHFQLEPTWGGRSDSAGTLRANCAHALLGCEGLIAQDVLVHLVDVLADPDKSVRVEAVRAIAQLDELAIPVLRLRTLIPGEDPEVLSVCFNALLAIQPVAAVPFVARFLSSTGGTAAEAAFALAETHRSAALAALLDAHRNPASSDVEPWLTEVLLSAIALTRLPQAIDFLLGLIEAEDREAAHAIDAIAKSQPNGELRERLEQAVDATGSPRLRRVFDERMAEYQ